MEKNILTTQKCEELECSEDDGLPQLEANTNIRPTEFQEKNVDFFYMLLFDATLLT